MSGSLTDDVRDDMFNYWQEHSTTADLTDMMLDSKAPEMSDAERNEILSYVPDFSGKDVLELGAGIGRFTEKLSDSANSVIAVDFVEKFVAKNKAQNSWRKNLSLLCDNVMNLQLNDNSVDMIFSNWLLMYLSDADIKILSSRILRWLRPGGHFFFRESCFKPSGDKMRSRNPTIYRSSSDYAKLVPFVRVVKGDGKTYGLKFITEHAVQLYIVLKNNPNQICWLMKVTEIHV